MSMNAGYPGPIYEAASDDSSSLNQKSMSLNAQAWKEKWRIQQGHRQGSFAGSSVMTIPAVEMRKEPRRELRKRLREDLSIVQGLYSRLEARELQLKRHSQSTGTYPTLSDAQFSGNDAKSAAGKEVTSSSPRYMVGTGLKRAGMGVNGRNRKSKPSKKKPEFLSLCRNILKMLMGHKDGWIFNEPVDAVKLGLSDYHLFIKKPMDLGTIKSKLDRKGYNSAEQFASDVRLTFDNAMTYNPPGNDVHQMADELLHLFEENWNAIREKLERQDGGRELNALRQLSREPAENRPVQLGMKSLQSQPTLTKKNANMDTAVAKKPQTPPKPKTSGKPKAPLIPNAITKPKADNKPKREMSYEEKANLVGSLQLLPAQMQDEFIRLMKERNPNLSQKDDEIEVDIDSIDNDTLWELDGCLKNCLKTVERSKKTVGEKSQPSAHAGIQNPSKQTGEPQEEDIDIMGDMPKATSPVVTVHDAAAAENRPSSSASSSSNTGSSSDSDSESSSASESDADDSGRTDKRQ